MISIFGGPNFGRNHLTDYRKSGIGAEIRDFGNFLILISVYLFPSKYTFSPIFKRFGIRSEKPKNEGNFCDFDFGGRNIFSNFVKISKIQKSTFQSLDSDRSLGPRPAPWEVVCELL